MAGKKKKKKMMPSGGGPSAAAPDDEAKGTLTRMKKRLTLDLEGPKSVRKQKMNELLSTPELEKLKLTTPELDRLIMQQNGLSVSVIGATTPSSFLNPKHVSEEEEQYVKPFEAALAQLREGAGAGASASVPPPLRFAPFSSNDVLPFPSDLTDVAIGRSNAVPVASKESVSSQWRHFSAENIPSLPLLFFPKLASSVLSWLSTCSVLTNCS